MRTKFMIDSKCLVLQTAQGEHMGFTLFNRSLSEPNGDCVFMVVPQKTEILKLPEVDVLYSLKEKGEHNWRWENDNLIVSFQGEDELIYTNSGNITHIPSNSEIGKWKEVKNKNA